MEHISASFQVISQEALEQVAEPQEKFQKKKDSLVSRVRQVRKRCLEKSHKNLLETKAHYKNLEETLENSYRLKIEAEVEEFKKATLQNVKKNCIAISLSALKFVFHKYSDELAQSLVSSIDQILDQLGSSIITSIELHPRILESSVAQEFTRKRNYKLISSKNDQLSSFVVNLPHGKIHSSLEKSFSEELEQNISSQFENQENLSYAS